MALRPKMKSTPRHQKRVMEKKWQKRSQRKLNNKPPLPPLTGANKQGRIGMWTTKEVALRDKKSSHDGAVKANLKRRKK